jgi:hypothetical protein
MKIGDIVRIPTGEVAPVIGLDARWVTVKVWGGNYTFPREKVEVLIDAIL